jgi:hypothetical protein
MKKFDEFFRLNEKLSDELENKLESDYLSLKKGVLELVENSVDEPEKLLNVQNFIHDYVKYYDNDKYYNDEDTILEGFIEESDIYEFYLKYQTDIDELLTDKEFFDEMPSKLNVYGLYDYLIEGTKKAVLYAMEIIYKDLFDEEI